jgi:hypothetical protein
MTWGSISFTMVVGFVSVFPKGSWRESRGFLGVRWNILLWIIIIIIIFLNYFWSSKVLYLVMVAL